MTRLRQHFSSAALPLAALLAAQAPAANRTDAAQPASPAARLAQADALFRQRDYDRAEAEYRACLADGDMTPEEAARAIAGGGAVLSATGDHGAAATAFRRAAQTLSPTNAFACVCQVLCADSLHRAGLFAEAAAAYDEATTTYGDGDARSMAADAYERAGAVDKAEARYREAAEDAPPEVFFSSPKSARAQTFLEKVL